MRCHWLYMRCRMVSRGYLREQEVFGEIMEVPDLLIMEVPDRMLATSSDDWVIGNHRVRCPSWKWVWDGGHNPESSQWSTSGIRYEVFKTRDRDNDQYWFQVSTCQSAFHPASLFHHLSIEQILGFASRRRCATVRLGVETLLSELMFWQASYLKWATLIGPLI